MFKYLYKDFIRNPELTISGIKEATIENINLFGNTFEMYADEWKHHVHIKCTDKCDSHCEFCIEKSEKHNPQNSKRMLESTKDILAEMHKNGHLKTVSITGGEPTVFAHLRDLISTIQTYDLKLFSINSNGANLGRMPKDFNGWINISKHAINDSHIFKRKINLEPMAIEKFKHRVPNGHVRFQCVLGLSNGLKTIDDILEYIDKYKTTVDNFSFRSLIINTDHSIIPELFTNFRNFLFDHGTCKEQAIQDYYVYENFDLNGSDVTVSYSNMNLLRQHNERNADNKFLQEIIVHPDGMITGSWNKKTLLIRN